LSIVLDGVDFAYEGDPVIKAAGFTLEGGLVHVALGSTGSGKTTLAVLLVGLLRPGEGTIRVDGEDPAGSRFNRQTVQLAFQFPEIQMFELTVEKEISYALKNFGLPPDRIRDRCEWALDCVGLPQRFLGRDPHSLSFGERRRVALASTIAVKPRYLILDEPLAGLDWTGRKSLVQIIDRLKQDGMTTLILTHETDLLGEIGDTVLIIDAGRVIGPVPASEFVRADPGASHLPEYMKLIHLLEARGCRIEGRPYRLEDVARALVDAVRTGQWGGTG
jgi:energy-coupling factor transport system ATP-binding protein